MGGCSLVMEWQPRLDRFGGEHMRSTKGFIWDSHFYQSGCGLYNVFAVLEEVWPGGTRNCGLETNLINLLKGHSKKKQCPSISGVVVDTLVYLV